MANYRKEFSHTAEYTRFYSGMRGVDFKGDGSRIAADRFAYLENMYRDYDGEGASLTESIPGFRKLFDFGARIHGVFHHRAGGNDFVLVHAGGALYRFSLANRDSIQNPVALISMADCDSHGFAYGESFYILDGTSYTEVNRAGSANRVSRQIGHAPYVPTLYKNGKVFEQRNILTEEFSEELEMTAPELYAYGTEGLAYEADAETPGAVVLVGMGTSRATSLFIPAYVDFEGSRCAVSRVANGAFASQTSLLSVKAAGGLSKIGVGAFASCTSLTTVSLPDSVSHLSDNAFSSCSALSSFKIGKGLAAVGDNVLLNCPLLSNIGYAGTLADIAAISGGPELHARIPFTPGVTDPSVTVKIPVNANALTAPYLYKDGVRVNATTHTTGGLVDYFVYADSDRKNLVGAKFTFFGTLSNAVPATDDRKSEKQDFFTLHPGITGNPAAVITACTLCAVFDERIFFAGNPAYPGTVFYAERDNQGQVNPTYFGSFNYFTDGLGPSPVTSLLAVRDSLAVFRKNDDGGGSVFYHVPKETGSDFLPKIYPVSYVHHGLCGVGASHSFFDDAVFVTGQGLSALEKDSVSGDGVVVCRSHNVNDKLLTENLSDAVLCKWCGYLCLLCGSHMYLADERQTFTHETGHTEYEWYYVTGIGTYTGDQTVYRYASMEETGYETPVKPDAKVTGTVQSEVVSGVTKYYVLEDGHKYRVYPTEEKTGGIFSPAVTLAGFDDFLFFGTQGGALCLFNNDKRGVAPPYLSGASDFDPADYAKKYARRIHPYYYTNDHHEMHFVLKTAMDNGGMPHLAKDSVKHSLVLKCRATGAQSLICEVKTDREGYRTVTQFPEDSLDFCDLSFSSLTLDTQDAFTAMIEEKSKKWIEKQICFYADGVFSPIGIFSIAYRYRIRGNVPKI